MPKVVYSPGKAHDCAKSMKLRMYNSASISAYPIGTVVRCDCGRLYKSCKFSSYVSDIIKMKRVRWWHPVKYKIRNEVAA